MNKPKSATAAARRLARSKSAMLIYVCIAVFAVFTLINPNFIGKDNIRGMMNNMSLSGTLGVGMALLLMGGGIDLAAGAEGCFGAILVALIMKSGIPWVPAMLIGLVFGVAAGALNAFFVNGLNFMGFIATIAMSSIYSGIGLVITKNSNIAISDQAFWEIGSATLFGVIPVPFIITIALIVIYGFILSRTRFGRSVLMCGGNRQAARLTGINPKRVTTILYMNCGMLSTLAGGVLAARMHNASPTAVSTGSLDAITAAVLGGVSFMGGGGNIVGLLIGIILLNGFKNGLVVVQLPDYWKIVAQGGLLIAALCVDYFNERSRAKALKAAKKAV
jgi:ribose/xylose/arabinose/galactoside ABC-type transport system permease subunit